MSKSLASVVYKVFDKKFSSLADKSLAAGSGFKSAIKQNGKLAEELHKPAIRKFRNCQLYSSFKDNIWGADLADMQSINKVNKKIHFLLSVIDIFSKYAWVVPLKETKVLQLLMLFKKLLDEPKRKRNKIWVDKGSEFHNRSMKYWLQDNNIEMYSIHIEGKSVVAERFIRILKTKICKYMTSKSKNVYTDKLDDIVNKYNNTYHNTIKMKPVDAKDNTYIDFGKERNNKDIKFKVDDYVRISKYKSIFAKGYTPNWSEEVFIIKKVKISVP